MYNSSAEGFFDKMTKIRIFAKIESKRYHCL